MRSTSGASRGNIKTASADRPPPFSPAETYGIGTSCLWTSTDDSLVFVSDHVVTIRPNGKDPRLPLILKSPNDRRVYFKAGGFVVADDIVSVRTRWGDDVKINRSQVVSVCLTFVPGRGGGDYRVLLTDSSNAVLAQDTGLFYSDLALRTLADAIPCDLRKETIPNLTALQDTHRGAFKPRWEAHPVRVVVLGFLVALVVLGLLLAIGTVIG